MIRKLLAWCKQRYNEWKFNKKFNLSERGKLKAITERAYLEEKDKLKERAAVRKGKQKARNETKGGITLGSQFGYCLGRLQRDILHSDKPTRKAERILKNMANAERNYKW